MSHQLGFIGLGRMGRNIVLHLLEQGIDVVAYNRTPQQAIKAVSSVEEMIKQLISPRVIWLMVPNGNPVDEVLKQLLSAGLQKGDYVIDGGNTYYKDTVRRSRELTSKGIHYIDCGTSGGIEGARNGACLMLGGEEEHVEKLHWLWNAMGSSDYFGPSGAGHFVKMVHNGIEYGMNQALGEGFEILANAPYKLDLAKVAHTWTRGSVIRGWLVELLAKALDADPKLDAYSGKVGGGETGKWALEEAIRAREKSQTNPTFAGKVVSALRAGYGGHKEPK